MAKELASDEQDISNNARKPHFYVVFSSQLASHQLKIPTKFARLMGGIDLGSVSLTGPSGNSWYADLSRHDDGIFIHNGWPVFVKDHSLEDEDFLVFRYDGQFHFTVQIFDVSACEKEAAFHAECSQEFDFLANHMEWKRKRDEISSEELLDGMPKRMKGINSPSNLDCSEKEIGTWISDYSGYQCKRPLSSKLSEARPIKTVTTEEVIKPKEIKYHKIFPTPSFHLDVCNNELGPLVKYRTMEEADTKEHNQGFMSVFTTSEEKKLAQSFSSCFPFFVRIMKRFNVSGSYTLNVPTQFSMLHLPNCKIEIILRNSDGKCWTVNSVPQRRVQTSHTFCGGWLAFVRDNGIQLGDICIFELISTCEFHVHSFASGKEPHGGGVTVAFNAISPEDGITSHRLSEDMPKTNGEIFSAEHLKSINKEEKGNRKFSMNKNGHARALKRFATAALCSLSKAGHENSVSGSRSSDKKNKSVSQPCGLRALLALDEQKAAQAFTSGFPNFVRIMKKFNVSGSFTLKIPYKFSAAHLPNCKTEIVLRGSAGKFWTVNSVPDSRGRMAHTFCGGWMAFVRDNDIKIGDVCIFELVGNYEMHVHISGVGRKSLEKAPS